MIDSSYVLAWIRPTHKPWKRASVVDLQISLSHTRTDIRTIITYSTYVVQCMHLHSINNIISATPSK